MRVLIADPHPLYRRGLASLLQDMHPTATILTVSNFQHLLHYLYDTSLDLVLLDLNLPGMPELEALAPLRQSLNAPLVVIADDDRPAQILRCIQAGAVGYIPKQTEPDIMMHALNLVLTHGVYLPPELLTSAKQAQPLPEFSDKQQQVLHQLLEGKSNKLIARELNLAEGTVKAHLWSIYQRLGVNSRLQAMAKARQLGWFGSAAANAHSARTH